MIITRQPGSTRTQKTQCHCPVCGGLECLCRPRFFAGQLLTEEDLNRLERYIVEKNKLHNRYLVGWGVACGLDVVCHPCQGWVTVKSGYALSPCGDDIVVCADEAVNVCDLITQCQTTSQWDCDPAWPRPDPLCGADDEPWVLYVCYDEKPSRGITPLRGGSGAPSCSPCSCGGSSACGCGCHEKKGAAAKSGCATAQPKSLPQCEPTVTCEGYTFKIRKQRSLEPARDLGTLVGRITACLTQLVKIQTAIAALSNSPQPKNDIIAIKEALIATLDEHGIDICDLYQRVQQTPLPTDATGGIAIPLIQQYLRAIVIELLRECICSALLPPCPGPADDNCVPIATLTVNCKDGCRIVRVCNWERRRLLTTFPNLEYWFGGLLSQSGLADFLTKLCCGPIRVPTPSTEVPGVFTPNLAASANRDAAPTLSENEDFLNNLLDSAVQNQGTPKSASVYKELGGIVRRLLSKFSSKP